jgi:hypothetical protein
MVRPMVAALALALALMALVSLASLMIHDQP